MNTSRTTKLANKATSASLSSVVSKTYELPSSVCYIKVFHSNEVEKLERDRIWAIYEANMYQLSKNSSFGWEPEIKRKELFHLLSRFILVYNEENTLLAFLTFRFEHEYEEDLLYCYEIQVASSAQGMGLGKRLLLDQEKLCKAFGMEKIMLTVLKSNPRSKSLYKSLGFILDPSSPGYVEPGDDAEEDKDSEDVDYEILSKTM